jgi:uncharacterized cofD-like protein
MIKWIYPGLKVKRWLILAILGMLLFGIGTALLVGPQALEILNSKLLLHFIDKGNTDSYKIYVIGILLLGIGFFIVGFRNTIYSVTALLLPKNERLVEILYQKRYLQKGPHVVVIGGGTGLSVLLRGIKNYTSKATAIVTVADDGGSSGILRDELGILPPGDIRNCLLALADTEPLMEKLFQHRFATGSLKGHSFGNLFIAAMTETLGDFPKAVKESSKVLAVRGQVLPVTHQNVILYAVTEEGKVIKGESKIPIGESPISKVFLKPKSAQPFPEALEAIKTADIIVLGPGSLYTSVIPNLLVRGVAKEIKKSKALKIYVCNIMTQAGETGNYKASDHLKAILNHTVDGLVDYCLISTTPIPDDIQKNYLHEQARPVEADIDKVEALGVKPVTGNLTMVADVVRHDPDRLSKVIMNLYHQNVRGKTVHEVK